MNPNSQQPWQPQQQPPQQSGPPQQIPAPQPDSQPNYSVDYLDQISTPIKQSRGPGKLILIIFTLLGVLIVVGIVVALLAGRPSTFDDANELSARMETLASISQGQHKNLRDNDLRATNTAYTLFLTNAISDLEAPLEAAGIKKSTTKAIQATEKTFEAELNAEFEDAKLNVILDQKYAREMSYQLDILQAMMRGIYNSTSSQELRGYLDSANSNLAPISTSFDEFAATK